MLYPRFNYQKAMPTPWGKADIKTLIFKGVYEVMTPSHGGIMVGKAQARKLLSLKAIKLGMDWNKWICFEEDCDWALFAYEQAEIYAEAAKQGNPKDFAVNPGKYTVEAIKEIARQTIKRWHPEYFTN